MDTISHITSAKLVLAFNSFCFGLGQSVGNGQRGVGCGHAVSLLCIEIFIERLCVVSLLCVWYMHGCVTLHVGMGACGYGCMWVMGA